MRKKEKVWLDKREIEALEMEAIRTKDLCMIQLGAWVGLRSAEIVSVKVKDLREEIIEDESCYWLHVEGKKTDQEKGEGKKKSREAYVPRKVYQNLRRMINEKKLNDSDPIIPNRDGEHMTTGGVRNNVYKVAERTYEKTDKEKFQKVSPHDLRRFFATYNLNELRKNPKVVMQIGGWKDLQSLKPYWGRVTKKTIHREMAGRE